MPSLSPSISNYSHKVERSYQSFQEARRNFSFPSLPSPFLFFFSLSLKGLAFRLHRKQLSALLSDDSHVSAVYYREREKERSLAQPLFPNQMFLACESDNAWLHR